MAASGRDEAALPKIYLLLENPSKSNNIGSILRCASAFGVVTIVAIGFSECAVQGRQASYPYFPLNIRLRAYLIHSISFQFFFQARMERQSIFRLLTFRQEAKQSNFCERIVRAIPLLD